ncbi:MAG TPA: gamma-glutamyltransferase [Candidatus Binataceae bacterium]|nr:gamma-glutamyltransferase [Candidatus Binataceae bacterium]
MSGFAHLPPVAARRWICALVSLLLISTATAPVAGTAAPAGTSAHREMVAAEGAEAAQAGLAVLERGGNAVDAAVATSLALGVTNSGSCGIGGGGFMLIYWAKTHQLYALDYRERAPMAASPTMYMRDGKPDEELARSGPLAVAVPGEAAGLDAALRRFGTMKFSTLAAAAIKLARGGFPLTPHMAKDVEFTAEKISHDPGFRAEFFDAGGAPLKAGATVRNPQLAALLERLGNDPARNFYTGEPAAQIADYMKQRGGLLTARDLGDYHPVWRQPIRLGYRGYELYTMPPPSSGGVVLEILGMLDQGPLGGLGADSPPSLARLIAIMREGFLDRADYADPAYVNVPIVRLLSPAHITEARNRALHHTPAPATTAAHDHGTSNFCVVDRHGNVVDVTTTINTIFGAKMMIPALGLILNDEMDDFTVAPGVPNAFKLKQAATNDVAPGKRPLSSMSPLIALKDGRPALVVGGSGGPTIISGVAQVAINQLDFRLDPQQAVDEPRIHDQAEPDIVFVEDAMAAKTTASLAKMGYRLKMVPELGAVNTIAIAPGRLRGAFDPRKGGGVAGD